MKKTEGPFCHDVNKKILCSVEFDNLEYHKTDYPYIDCTIINY